MFRCAGLAAVAFSAFFVLTPTSAVRADDEAPQSDAGTQLEKIEETSQEAVVAPTDEEAKDLSGQGFDTPSTN